MSNNELSRRDFIGRALSISAAGALGASLAACGNKGGKKGGAAGTCSDVSKLTAAEKKMRTDQAYVEASPHADKHCQGCALWNRAATGQPCGSCKVIKGPINPKGYCKLFQPKPKAA